VAIVLEAIFELEYQRNVEVSRFHSISLNVGKGYVASLISSQADDPALNNVGHVPNAAAYERELNNKGGGKKKRCGTLAGLFNFPEEAIRSREEQCRKFCGAEHRTEVLFHAHRHPLYSIKDQH